MHWFPFYTSDFIGATMDCSCAERAMYSWMLVVYYERREPFPKDGHRLARLIGADSIEEKALVKTLLHRFFVEREDGWYQPQAEEIIARQNTSHQRLSEAGRKGVEARLKRGIKPGLSDAQAKENQNHIHNQTQNQTQKQVALPPWLDLEVWSVYLDHRRAKRAPLTRRGTELCIKKLERLRAEGQDPRAVIEQSVANGWTGLFELKTDQGGKQAWWTSEEATKAKARELGIHARPGECWNEFRERIRRALATHNAVG